MGHRPRDHADGVVSLLLALALLGLPVGSLYALFAVSFGVIYNVTHIFHLAHGAVIGTAGYVIFFLAAKLRVARARRLRSYEPTPDQRRT